MTILNVRRRVALLLVAAAAAVVPFILDDHAATGHIAAQSDRVPAQDTTALRMMMDMHMRMMNNPDIHHRMMADTALRRMHMQMMMDMHGRMMQDSVIHQRMMADTALHQMMLRMMERMPPEMRERMRRMMDAGMHMHRRGTSPPARSRS
jgi:hypothetical protein